MTWTKPEFEVVAVTLGSHRIRGDSLEARKEAVLFQFRLLTRP